MSENRLRSKLLWLVIVPLTVAIIAGVVVEIFKLVYLTSPSAEVMKSNTKAAEKNDTPTQPRTVESERPQLAARRVQPDSQEKAPPIPLPPTTTEYVGKILRTRPAPLRPQPVGESKEIWRLTVPQDKNITRAFVYHAGVLTYELSVVGAMTNDSTFVGRTYLARGGGQYTPDDLILTFSKDGNSAVLRWTDTVKGTAGEGTLRPCQDVTTTQKIDECSLSFFDRLFGKPVQSD